MGNITTIAFGVSLINLLLSKKSPVNKQLFSNIRKTDAVDMEVILPDNSSLELKDETICRQMANRLGMIILIITTESSVYFKKRVFL